MKDKGLKIVFQKPAGTTIKNDIIDRLLYLEEAR